MAPVAPMAPTAGRSAPYAILILLDGVRHMDITTHEAE
jgi:hypothetical protein